MRARLTGAAAAAALAVLAAFVPPATGQEVPGPTPSASPTPAPTETATPTPTPTPEEQERAERDERDRKSKSVRRIYRDFERDGRIDDCDHTKKALKKARRSVADSYEEDYPDFRDALNAAIERHDKGKCEEQQAQREQDAADQPDTGTGGDAGSGGGTTTPPAPPPPAAPTAPPPPATSPDSGTLPDFDGGAGGTGSDGDDGSLGDVSPLPGEEAIPEGTPAPGATPAPTVAAPQPPRLVVTRATAEPNLFVPQTMLAIALLGLLFAALSAFAAKKSGRLAGVEHAWREAAWRTSGTWSDFTDWLRPGR